MWCLFEIWYTLQIGSKLSVATNIDPFTLQETFKKCNMQSAIASIKSDQDRIFQEIEQTTSLQQATLATKSAFVDIARKGYSSSKTAATCLQYALMLECQGQYEEAIIYYKKTIELQESNSVDIGVSYTFLGNIYDELQDYQGSLPLFERALHIFETIWLSNSEQAMITLYALGRILSKSHNYLKERIGSQSLTAILKISMNNENLDTVQYLNNLAFLLRSIGRHNESLLLFRQSLSIQEKLVGVEHPDTAISMNNLASVLYFLGQYSEALQLFKQSLDIIEKVFGAEHPKTAVSLNNLANALRGLRQYNEALPLYQKSFQIRQKVFGIEHSDTATSLNNLGNVLRDMGKFSEALPLFQLALRIQEKLFGIEHANTATFMNNIASLLYDMDNCSEAILLLKQSLSIQEKLFGVEHLDTATTMNNLASILHDMGEFNDALSLYKQALSIRENLLGTKHPETVSVMNNLAELLKEMNKR